MIRISFRMVCLGWVICGCATTSTGGQNRVERSVPEASTPTAIAASGRPAPVGATVAAVAIAESSVVHPDAGAIVGLTLEAALRLADENRPELAALRHRIGMAEGDAQQAGTWPNPTLSMGLDSYTPGRDNRPPDLTALDNMANLVNQAYGTQLWVPGVPESRNPDQLQHVVSISQTMPIWGTQRLARKAGLLDTERWRHEYERTRLELYSHVKKAFDEVVYQQERVATAVDLDQTLGQILEVTRARVEAGDVAEVELIKGEADYERFTLEVESARTGLNQARIGLARALGNPTRSVQSCAGTALTRLPDVPEATLTKLSEDHPQAKVWEFAQDAAEAHVAAAESRRWPNPTLGVGYRHYAFTDQDTVDVSLEFELPLFDRKQGEIRSARERAKHEAESIAAARNAVEEELQQTLAGYASQKRKAEAFRQRVLPRMEEALSIARARFEAGDTGMLEVLDAYRSLAEARLAYLSETYHARAAYYDLEYLLGKGDLRSVRSDASAERGHDSPR